MFDKLTCSVKVGMIVNGVFGILASILSFSLSSGMILMFVQLNKKMNRVREFFPLPCEYAGNVS